MDLQEAQKHLEAWLAADLALSTGQSYSIGGRSLSRADGPYIREQITYWQRIVDGLKLPAGTSRVMTPSWT